MVLDHRVFVLALPKPAWSMVGVGSCLVVELKVPGLFDRVFVRFLIRLTSIAETEHPRHLQMSTDSGRGPSLWT